MPNARPGTRRVAPPFARWIAPAFGVLLAFAASAQPPGTPPAVQLEGRASSLDPPALSVGSPAPALDAVEWLRAAGPTEIKPGRVHVVTFFATWCPASRRALPMLSSLSDRFAGKAAFIAIASRDAQGESRGTLDSYVRSSPGAVTFPIAADERRHAWSAWMDAADRPWLPTTFIVSADGRIAWIGNPLWIPGELEDAIDRAIAGTLDAASTAELHRTWLVHRERTVQLEEEVLQAHAANRHDLALRTLDKLIEFNRAGEPGYVIWKIEIMLSFGADPAAALAEGRRALSGPISRDPEALAQLGATLFEAEGLPNRDLELADAAFRRALEIGGALSNETLSTAAQVARERGQLPRAIELLTLAVSASRDNYEKQSFEQRLKEYQSERDTASKR